MPKPDPNVCNEKELRFVEAYATNGRNGAAAAREAGYLGGPKGDGFKVRASKVLARKRVQAALALKVAEIAKLEQEAEARVRSEKISEMLRKRHEIGLAGVLTAHQRKLLWSAIAAGELEGFTGSERIRASELLAKAEGDFVERHHVKVDLGDVDEDALWAELEETRRAKGQLIDATPALPAGDGDDDDEKGGGGGS